MKKHDIKNLKFRYLLWLYKMAKDDFDRIERKFTQLEIDKQMLAYFTHSMDFVKVKDRKTLNKLLHDFRAYVAKKEKDGKSLKFDHGRLKPDYYFLMLKLEAVEKIILEECGQKALKKIKALYEDQMQKRILESTEH